jgi:hypothetical protein
MTGAHDKRRISPSVKKVKTPTGDGVDMSPIGVEPKMRHVIADAFYGSKNLCAAILATGKTHGPMTQEQQTAAIEYAHSIKFVDTVGQRVRSEPPRTSRLVEWNLKK